MIPGTSKILSKSGPGTLLTITKMLQKIQEKLWNHPGKILFMSIWDIKKFEISQFWTHQTRTFFDIILAPRPPPKKKISERFQRIFRWWNLGILGQTFF